MQMNVFLTKIFALSVLSPLLTPEKTARRNRPARGFLIRFSIFNILYCVSPTGRRLPQSDSLLHFN